MLDAADALVDTAADASNAPASKKSETRSRSFVELEDRNKFSHYIVDLERGVCSRADLVMINAALVKCFGHWEMPLRAAFTSCWLKLLMHK